MAIKLNKEEGLFRNELIFAVDAKAVNIDNVILNLCMLLRFNGVKPRGRTRRKSTGFIEISTLLEIIGKLEESGVTEGFANNPEAVTTWMRSNLVNMVYRGNVEREKISSLRPIHLESYRIRNAKHARDYNTADQVYLMLNSNPSLKRELKAYLGEGWDDSSKNITPIKRLDVDSLGILHLIKKIKPSLIGPDEGFSKVRPILQKQADLFCEDIHRLLVYKRKIPRSVIMEYLKTLTAFHLSIYTQKLIHLLPEMVKAGKIEVPDNWNIVVDMTDNSDSKVAQLAIQDTEEVYNKLHNYVRATFQINAVMRRLKLDQDDSKNLEQALQVLKNPPAGFDSYFENRWDSLSEAQSKEDRETLMELTQFEESFFDKYIQAIMEQRGAYQLRYSPQFLDNICLKNDERGLMTKGRSRKHPRRFVIGTRLLETLVQIIVLNRDDKTNGYYTKSLSIEELMSALKSRYGLIINGVEEERFKNADITTTLAFKDNVESFKQKLRQIGFYSDLSDAYILQKINPRYPIN